MFYYCEKCADIKNAGAKAGQDVPCEVCGAAMKPVPQEYLMPGGSFFKSQAVRQQFISMIQSQETYDPDIGEKKEELKEAAKAEEQRRIAETNERMKQEQFHMTCPVCGSRSVQKISAAGKYAKIGVLGILGADDLGKTWKCTVCGSKF